MLPLNVWNMHARNFSGKYDCLHTNIWKFIISLQREQSLVRAEVNRVLGGHLTVQKKKYNERQDNKICWDT